MNIIIRTLKQYIKDPDIRFVFPSQTAADLWARKTCTLAITRSVAANRFLAWDRFKEEFIQRETEREPVSNVVRKLFSDALIRKNAGAAEKTDNSADGGKDGGTEDGFPFTSLIPAEYAHSGATFVSLIAGLLPSLSQWEKLMESAKNRANDTEDRDLYLVKAEYTAFLKRHGLFEPSWEKIKINKEKTRYVIFFPELIEDFAEYNSLLEAPHFKRIGAEGVREKPGLVHFQSAREEIRSTATELRKLHEEEGIPYEDMAVSVPELEENESILLKEFYLHGIPVVRRAGKTLGESGAGMLFTLINKCAASQFSFNSFKALILNDHIPWREKEKNKALIKFGINYNCVSSYTENDKLRNIWDEAFGNVKSGDEINLRGYYRELKKRILSLVNSENFANLRKNYFTSWNASSGGLLDMEKISEEDDAVLARCIEELNSLIDLEEKLDDSAMVPSSPSGFFVSCLDEKDYVRAGQKPGVNIFKWRVAAAAPFSCHFVLNASQSAATVLYQPMKFLRQDKRKLLGIEDSDATGAFFSLYDTGSDEVFKSRVRISASTRAFSGWAIPHSFYPQSNIRRPPEYPEEPYSEERRFWRDLGDRTQGAELKKIYPLQKSSYENWKNKLVEKKGNYSFFKSSVSDSSLAGKLLEGAIPRKDGYLTVTPRNDLNVFFDCTLKWLFERIFRAQEFSLEAVLLDDTLLGILYHQILEDLFGKIRKEDGAFDSRRLNVYKLWALEATKTAIEEHPAFKGPLAIPLVSPQSAGMAKKISALLETEAKYFDGYRVAELELRVMQNTEELCINGVIDRVSVSPDGEPVIIDYKTKLLPDQTDKEKLGEYPLKEFQMPLYIRLYEEMSAADKGKDAVQVKGACFLSITDSSKRIKSVMGINKAPNREKYTPFLEAAEKQIKEFSEKVNALDFIPREISFKDCADCIYKPVCRSTYFLNAAG